MVTHTCTCRHCLQTLTSGWDPYHLDDEKVTERTVFVVTGTVSATNLEITDPERSQPLESGRSAATAFPAEQKPGMRQRSWHL